MAPVTHLPCQDLAAVLQTAGPLLEPLRGGRILVTGATGFFGSWLLESLAAANRRLGAGISVVAQSRAPERFLRQMPHLGPEAGIEWLAVAPADLSAARLDGKKLDAVVHLVTEADNAVTLARPVEAWDTIVGSTRRALDLAVATRASRFLYTSSGAVYRRPPGWQDRLREDHPWIPMFGDLSSPYAYSGGLKGQAEHLCAAYARQHGLGVSIARCFSFVGPRLPLEGKFALGNFLSDALHGRDILLKSDGSAVRSYLYAGDLAVWLWTILLRGEPGCAYNVGAEEAWSLRDLAGLVRREVAPGAAVRMPEQTDPPTTDYYVPDTGRARRQLGLRETVALPDALRRTAEWARRALQH